MKDQILHVSTGAELGGAERVLLDLARSLDRERFRVHVVVPRRGRLAEALEEVGISPLLVSYWGRGHRLGRYSSWREYVSALRSLPHIGRAVIELARFVNEAPVALIHAHGLKAQIFSVALAPLVRARLVWHVHDFLRRRRIWPFFRILSRIVPDVVLVPSHAVANEFSAQPNILVIPNGVDLREFSPASSKRAEGRLRVGMIGALAPWKGQHVFLQAAERVSRVLSEVEFLIVGDEIYDTTGHEGFRRELEREVVRRQLSSRVRFLGFRADVATILRELDLVVHCSLEPEPFGRVLIEAMACGLPVIASRGGATEEIVREGETGLLVPRGEVLPLADAMLALLQDAAWRARLGRAARMWVERTFDLREQTRRVEALYDALLSRGRERARSSRAITSSSRRSRKSS
ncbi:MAG: glycosyltransferase family 4 protein [Blastocatellia bacterium]|nr:glycosyltransferase family 4 protein [Blastocatellia bacterium]MCX7752079.1 glycosyltransferase family 4 protein [Blastocatellia bacterium]MDW8167572.1 glycosyltransferase family 4 protein [Acidobacteriota bacterium]